MMSFRHFLPNADLGLSSVFFSLVLDLDPSENAARLLAEQFHDVDAQVPEVQEKLEWLQSEWKRYEVRSRTTVTSLSVFLARAVEKCERLLNKKTRLFGAYDEQVFVQERDSDVIHVGSRPCESEGEFLRFLDEFYAVSFNKLIDQEAEAKGAHHLPLLRRFASRIRDDELHSFVTNAVTNFRRKQTTADLFSSPRSARAQSPASPRKRSARGERSKPPESPRSRERRPGLRRSNSATGSRGSLTRLTSSLRRSSSNVSLSRAPVDDHRSLRSSREFAASLDDLDTSLANASPKSTSSFFAASSNKRKLDAYARRLMAAPSCESLATSGASGDVGEDPLTSRGLEPWQLDNMSFGERFVELECLTEWLGRWIGRSHALTDFNRPPPSAVRVSRQQSVMRIRVPPRLFVYSVWHLEFTSANTLIPARRFDFPLVSTSAPVTSPRRRLPSVESLDATAADDDSLKENRKKQLEARLRKEQRKNINRFVASRCRRFQFTATILLNYI